MGSRADQGQARRVVAATDGGESGMRAVTYAAHEAKRLGIPLEIVHVLPAYLPTGPLPMVPDGSLQQSGELVMRHAVAAVERVEPELPIVRNLAFGSRVTTIVDATEWADLAVVGARDVSLAERVWTGSTVAGVAARAGCPVLVLPPSYDPGRGRFGRVTVGVKDPENAQRLLATAFAEAEREGSELLVMHAWRLGRGYDDLVSNEFDRQVWHDELTKVIDGILIDLQRSHPTVEVRVGVVHGQPAHALIGASKACDRLLISRPAHLEYFHHLGGTARALLREAHCPVEVVAPALGA